MPVALLQSLERMEAGNLGFRSLRELYPRLSNAVPSGLNRNMLPRRGLLTGAIRRSNTLPNRSSRFDGMPLGLRLYRRESTHGKVSNRASADRIA